MSAYLRLGITRVGTATTLVRNGISGRNASSLSRLGSQAASDRLVLGRQSVSRALSTSVKGNQGQPSVGLLQIPTIKELELCSPILHPAMLVI